MAKKRKASQDGPQSIPPGLDCPEFRDAWEQWEQHRREKRKTITPRARELQLRKLLSWGKERAIAALMHSIMQGYAGIYEERQPAGHWWREGPGGGTGAPLGQPGRVRSPGGKYDDLPNFDARADGAGPAASSAEQGASGLGDRT